MRVALLALLLLAVAAPAQAAAPAASGPVAAAVSFERDAKDPRWVQGTVRVPVSAEAVWSALQPVDRWVEMFTDIKTLKVLERSPGRWRVRVETFAFNCGAHDYIVTFAPRVITVRADAPGVVAVSYVRLTPQGRTTDITYSLFLEAHGVAAWFHSEKSLREKQEVMTRRYLEDFMRLFPAASS